MIQKIIKTTNVFFFGAAIDAPWPSKLPTARILPESERHITLAFLGNTSFAKLKPLLKNIPLPPCVIEPTAWCNKIIFLPPNISRVVAVNVKWFEKKSLLIFYQKKLTAWLHSHQFYLGGRAFLPHITIARAPFQKREWTKSINPLLLRIKAIHLYDYLNNLTYIPLWSHHFHPAFIEKEHTADLAFDIFGESIQELHGNAKIALAFKFPPLLSYFNSLLHNTLDDIVMDLNNAVTQADTRIGCPFKAVSFHGTILLKKSSKMFQWEMIVDI